MIRLLLFSPDPPDALTAEIDKEKPRVLRDLKTCKGKWLDSEIEKLDRWTEDFKLGLEQENKDLDKGTRNLLPRQGCSTSRNTSPIRMQPNPSSPDCQKSSVDRGARLNLLKPLYLE